MKTLWKKVKTVVGANKILIPVELDRFLTPALRVFVEQQPFSRWFGLGLSVLLLYGPIVGPHTDHNGWRYLIAPLLCAPVAGCFLGLFPPNPYRGYSARIAGLQDLDIRDSKASALVSLFRSQPARIFLRRASLRVAMTQLVVMIVLLVLCMMTSEVSWNVSSYWLWQGVLGCCLGSFITVASDFFAWALRNWVSS